ncbi:MAG: transglutaminase domain-containing protein, partial [Deltaproteobacteria bacterium]|nr:transglutaminase domain-containing protein [Deltaproteobacteria bacterium]
MITIFFLSQWPTTNRQGVNWEVREIKIPLYFKALQFFSRHYEMKHYTHQILQNEQDDLEKIKKLHTWIDLYIHTTPKGFDIIDDHPLHILIRRYGTGDQMADLFSLLCTYAGLKAFYKDFKVDQGACNLAFVQYQETWYAFDFFHGIEFMNDQMWATLQDIQNNHFILKNSHKNKTTLSQDDYYALLKNFNPNHSFSTRNLQQMPWPRLKLFLGL